MLYSVRWFILRVLGARHENVYSVLLFGLIVFWFYYESAR